MSNEADAQARFVSRFKTNLLEPNSDNKADESQANKAYDEEPDTDAKLKESDKWSEF